MFQIGTDSDVLGHHANFPIEILPTAIYVDSANPACHSKQEGYLAQRDRRVTLEKQVSGDRIRSSPNVVSRVVADEALVVPIRGGAGDLDSIYTFNDAGTKLWMMIEKGQSAGELAEYLETSYGITPGQAKTDAENFLAELSEEGLIEQA